MAFTLQPVFGKSLIGREQLVEEMLGVLKDKKSNTGYSIYGVRRVGKTSILKEIESRLSAQKDIVVVPVCLWEVVPFTLENFLEEFVVTIMEKYKKLLPIEQKIKDLMVTPLNILKSLIKNLQLGIKVKENIEFLLSFKTQKTKNYTELFKKAFMLPEELAKSTKIKCVIILDEFPTILELKEGIDLVRALRTLHEKQKNTAFCISGSIRKTMNAVIFSSTSPFYKQFLIKEIKPLNKEGVEKLLKINLKEYGIRMDEKVVDEIYKYTMGAPFYVQFLGKLILEKKLEFVSLESIKKIIKSFLLEEGNTIFLDYLHSFSIKEQEILSVIACRDIENVTNISKETNETPNTISTYLLYLIDKGALEKKERGKYIFADNMFKEWLKLRQL